MACGPAKKSTAALKIDGGAFIGSVGIFHPLDWPEPEIIYSLDQPFWRQGFAAEAARAARLAVRSLPILPRCKLHPARQFRIEAHRSASWGGSGRFTSAHSSGATPSMNAGGTTGQGNRSQPAVRVNPEQAGQPAIGLVTGAAGCTPYDSVAGTEGCTRPRSGRLRAQPPEPVLASGRVPSYPRPYPAWLSGPVGTSETEDGSSRTICLPRPVWRRRESR